MDNQSIIFVSIKLHTISRAFIETALQKDWRSEASIIKASHQLQKCLRSHGMKNLHRSLDGGSTNANSNTTPTEEFGDSIGWARIS